MATTGHFRLTADHVMLQAHGSPGAFWESEQESLLFVIEMKSERLREQNGKLQDMEQLVRLRFGTRLRDAVVCPT